MVRIAIGRNLECENRLSPEETYRSSTVQAVKEDIASSVRSTTATPNASTTSYRVRRPAAVAAIGVWCRQRVGGAAIGVESRGGS